MSLTKQEIEILSRPFDAATIGVKVQSFSKDRTRAMLVLYLQHTDVYVRLEEVDPSWSMFVVSTTTVQTDLHYAAVALTVNGVTRVNTGEGSEPKGALSDAIKRAAMLFGVGRYLYDAELVWVKYNEQEDRFRTWTIKDYEDNCKSKLKKPGTSPVIPLRPDRDILNKKLMELYTPYLKKFPSTQFPVLLKEKYGVEETRLMTVEQLKNLVDNMDKELRGA